MADPESSAAGDTPWAARPRALTPRGVAIVIAVLIFAVFMATAGVYLRRTRLEQTTAFWGPETIRALQSGETLRVVIPADSPVLHELPEGERREEAVVADLSGTPGLGHFRHALLDERHYEWSTEQAVPIDRVDVENPEFVVVEVSGPPDDIVPSRLQLELSQGWVGPVDGESSVQLIRRARPAIRNFIVTLQDIRSAPTP